MLDCLPQEPAIQAQQRRRGQRKRVLVADLFCGAGGSSTGAQRALASMGFEMELVCVNHWDKAIETHKRNHPNARHYCQDIATVRPLEAVPEGRLDLLMASPTCTFHSRARGGRPTSDQQRMDPWHLLDWLTQLDVRCLLIENVPEFINWGRVDQESGRPVAKEKGGYFLKWLKAIKSLGYKVDYRILVAADYGDATTRERFFMIARKDRKPIVWPEPSHSKDGGTDLFGTRKKWRAAREIIDWGRKGRSIFERDRPLAPKTMARILAGAVKTGWPEAFLVVLRQHMDGQAIDSPLPTITAGGNHIGLAQPLLTPFVLGQQSCAAPRPVSEPVPTISTQGAISLTEPVLIHMKGCSDARAIDLPTPTITNIGCLGVAEPMLAPYYGAGSGESCTPVDRPMPTCTTKARFGLVEPVADANTTDERFALANSQGRIRTINGKPYVLDILFRMLEPSELAAAMGFSDGDFEYEFAGSKSDQTKQIGNAVPVHTSTALVSAIMSI